jgi:hypothetical protein
MANIGAGAGNLGTGVSSSPFANISNYPGTLEPKDQLRTIFGGNVAAIDPYTTGYHYLYITLPKDSGLSKSYGTFLQTVCQSVTVPGITVNNIEYSGLNDFKWNYPGTVEYDNQRFTAKFIEFAGLPIYEIIGEWVNVFRNMIYGVSHTTNGPKQTAFKGSALYATTLFDGVTVQYAAHFTGIYPTKIPSDAFSSDKATHDKVEHEIEFAFDMMYTGQEVLKRAQNRVASTYNTSVGGGGGATTEYDKAVGAGTDHLGY